ncbi:MAG: FAD binding domain-containing protein [Burkholderiaceae bacterium]
MDLIRPRSFADALACLARGASEGRVPVPLAGATDLYPPLAGSAGLSGSAPWLDLSDIDELRGISRVAHEGQSFWRVGALTRWSDLARGPHRHADWRALSEAAAEVGGRQIQNRATLGGNLCHASPAADGVPPLLALNAQVVLSSVSGSRRLPLESFVLGPRRTARRADELLEAVLLPVASARRDSRFLKLGHRRYLVISAVMVAARADWGDDDRLTEAALAVGACGPTAVRLPWFADVLPGCRAAELQAVAMRPWPVDALAPLAPIDDLRGSASWRRQAAEALTRRALLSLAANGART